VAHVSLEDEALAPNSAVSIVLWIRQLEVELRREGWGNEAPA